MYIITSQLSTRSALLQPLRNASTCSPTRKPGFISFNPFQTLHQSALTLSSNLMNQRLRSLLFSKLRVFFEFGILVQKSWVTQALVTWKVSAAVEGLFALLEETASIAGKVTQWRCVTSKNVKVDRNLDTRIALRVIAVGLQDKKSTCVSLVERSGDPGFIERESTIQIGSGS